MSTNPTQELSGTTVTANMLTGLGVDEYFTRADSTGTSDFLDNALGSTIALADTTGTVQTQYTYSPFGGTTVQGAANANSYQFTGRENDGQGLYYYRARYYDPTLSRFISQDPTGFVGGVNVYAYVYEDPANLTDLLGLSPCGAHKNTKGCVVEALTDNAVPLALDAAGFIPGEKLGGDLAKTLVDVGAAVGSTAYSAYHQNVGGALIGIASIHVAGFEPAAASATEGILSAVPVVGTLLNLASTGHDLYSAYRDFQRCVRGN